MRTNRLGLVAFALLAAALPLRAADAFTVDPIHSCVSFKIEHMGISFVHGRFDEVAGSFTLDSDPSKCSFALTCKVESVDTNNKGRDKHLQGGDFFNSAQFPVISFKSTSVKVVPGGYEVTGDLTMHGVTKPLSFTLKGGKRVQMQGKEQSGFTTDLALKRSDFGMDKMLNALGDEVFISIGMEGTKN